MKNLLPQYMKELRTDRQESIYSFIENYQCDNGYSPKITEIQHAFQIKSVNGVIKHLQALEKKGWIIRDNTARGIALVEKALAKKDTQMSQIPIFGMIPAGNPQNLSDYIEGYHAIDSSMLKHPESSYALIVKGESMIDSGICEGDVVLVERKEPKVGDIVVALIDGGNTLKRFLKDSKGVPYLKAENVRFPEIHPTESLEIQGVAVYIIRKL